MTQLKVFKMVLLVFVAGMLVWGFLMFTSATVTTVVDLQDDQLYEKDGDLYIIVENQHLKVNDKSRKQIDLQMYETYNVVYSYNRFNDTKGKVERIEPYGANAFR